MDLEKIKELAEELYNYMKPYCISIYLGGSHCQQYIENPHDIDLICFSDKPVDMCHIRRLLYFYQKKHNLENVMINMFQNFPETKDIIDLVQVRTKQREEHSYGSYIHKDMILLVGEEIKFTFDPLNKDKKEYINILLDTIQKFHTGKLKNEKRWYQIFRGYFLLKNNSYDLTDEQKIIINKTHDKIDTYKELQEEVEKWLISQI